MSEIRRIKIPKFKSQETNAIDAIRCGHLASGEAIEAFETKLKSYFGMQYAVLTNSGNSALFLALKALNVNNGKVLTPAISTCFAIENAVLTSSNKAVYGDVDLNTSNLSSKFARKVFQKESFDAIISPDFSGILSDIKQLKSIGVPVIQDAAQAFLSNHHFSSVADTLVFSFYPTKIMNAIDGGALLTNDIETYKRASDLVYYDQQLHKDDVPRFNLKMNNVQAAFGLGLFEHLQAIEEKLLQLQECYGDFFRSIQGVLQPEPKDGEILYKYVLRFENKEEAKRFIHYLETNGIETSFEFIPVTNDIDNFKNAWHLTQTACSIPMYYDLRPDEVRYMFRIIEKYFKKQ